MTRTQQQKSSVDSLMLGNDAFINHCKKFTAPTSHTVLKKEIEQKTIKLFINTNIYAVVHLVTV